MFLKDSFNDSHPPRKATVTVQCSDSISFTASDDGTTAKVELLHPSACIKNKKKGLSFGSIALIVIACLIVLYLALGIPINIFVRKKKGVEVIPFIYFWTSIPGLVIDGIRFIFSPCCKGGSGYSNIEG